MSYLFVANSQKATAVHYSAKAAFTSPNATNLILAKCNTLELYSFSDQGLNLIKTVPIFGRVIGLEAYRPPGATKDLLFVLVERKKFCILEYDEAKEAIVTYAAGNLKERKGRSAELGQKCFPDPDLRVMGLQLYDSFIKVSD